MIVGFSSKLSVQNESALAGRVVKRQIVVQKDIFKWKWLAGLLSTAASSPMNHTETTPRTTRLPRLQVRRSWSIDSRGPAANIYGLSE